ncbi:MAG: PHB depolymerase family esterase [Reichenbachiella sp.]|uniref:extracellular catalytic domain type 1 short-chain-length polyhydroxyalkanoate depolymerase n=1 Tax=Reichenbachiella sp. TaxID=2184521 RepID=UPI0032644423
MKKTLNLLIFCLMLSYAQAQLTAIPSFGSNPGNLSMYIHTPGSMPSNAPLVLVMHGCTQNATSYSNESDWNMLADTYKFYVIHAQQKSTNNSSECFNWFENGDINRGSGEAASLKNMVDYMKSNYSVDNSQVFATGFSAGGAMTTTMLATYPDVFSAGAVMSGLPYKVATSSTSAFMAMFGNVNQSPTQLGNSVRGASGHTGPWPRVVTFHGASDYTVYFMNQNEIMEQWTNVHSIDQTADVTDNSFNGNSLVTRSEYHDGCGMAQVVTYAINTMGHTIAIDPGPGTTQGGSNGSYTNDVNLFSSYWAAEFFGLTGNSTPSLSPPTNVSALATSSTQIDLTWTDNESNETSYTVERASSSGGSFSAVATLSANATSYSDTGLSASTTYFYKIKVTDASANTASSSEISATTPSGGGGTPTSPIAPSGLSATATGSSSIMLSWQDNSNNEDSFVLERSKDNESNYMQVTSLPANTTSYSDTGLILSTTYYYRLSASNNEGMSTFSNSASAATEGEAVITTLGNTSGSGILSYSNSNSMGQSFTATEDGEVVEVDVRLVYSISGSSLRVFQGNTVSGTPAYEQTGISAGSGWQSIGLDIPFDVIDGQTYTFQLTNSSIRYSYSNTYGGGNFWYNTISYGVFDAAFTISVSSSSSARIKAASDMQPLAMEPIHVYPNPSRGVFQVQFGQTIRSGKLELISPAGQILLSQLLEDQLSVVQVDDIKPGMYFLKIVAEDRNYMERILLE